MNRTQKGSLWDMTGRARITTLIGAGGKTTSLGCIAKEISSYGEPVVLTTTTKVYPFAGLSSWLSQKNSPPVDFSYPCFWYAADDLANGKWVGPSTEVVDREIKAAQQAGNQETRKWVIEGDGARGHKLKCWAEYEPQIPLNSEYVVLILDSGLWGKTLDAGDVHRLEYCEELIGKVWCGQTFQSYLENSPAFDPKYRHMSWAVLFNENSSNSSPSVVIHLEELISHHYRKDSRPSHLRIAGGDVKTGEIRWLDLW